jgi:glycosyltransferase involved in cell wall biosynthesis
MATELPAVGTTVGGVPEVIVDGRTGLLVPPRDPPTLARALATLLESAETRERFGGAGRERVVREFHIRDTVRRTLDVYRSLTTADVRAPRGR